MDCVVLIQDKALASDKNIAPEQHLVDGYI